MKKDIAINYGGTNSRVGELLVNRLVPNHFIHAVGPFVFLDHLYPTEQKPKAAKPVSGEFAHPHRGIATFTYIFSGELEHFDSKGNRGTVGAGGAQWMKAGNGIIHDEGPSPAFQREGGLLHGTQFWINLPGKNKLEEGKYLALHSAEIPEIELPGDAGVVRVVIGKLGEKVSPVETYSEQFIYHVKLNAKSSYVFKTQPGIEYAAFVPVKGVKINGSLHENSDLVVFGPGGDEIVLENEAAEATELLLFGGEPYTEPIVAEGPFVMNSKAEIAEAYKDFFNGKYGTIDYEGTDVSLGG
ncbi:pirin family protein [Paradesertivirga mongoliensis]|uniref:Pirin family protein n=1 Tax=Paradesertivirga mongoliensis TaxID=2100740 RepID=A0ABW4ZNF2_9SPHI|nr:pirin family protein [Pedobacter mongoliensis]